VGYKFNVNLDVLQSDLYVPTKLQIESKDDSLLCLKSIIVLLLFLFVVMHLFVDLLMFAFVTAIMI